MAQNTHNTLGYIIIINLTVRDKTKIFIIFLASST